MSIVENLHDLCCTGQKDVKMALENVQDYNLAKNLTRKCTIPDYTGNVREDKQMYNIIYSIQMDIELYNYVHILFHDYFGGRINSATNSKESSAKVEDGGLEDSYDGDVN